MSESAFVSATGALTKHARDALLPIAPRSRSDVSAIPSSWKSLIFRGCGASAIRPPDVAHAANGLNPCDRVGMRHKRCAPGS